MSSILDRFDHWQNKTFGQQDPNSPKCCFCFPLKCGIIMIGAIAMFDTLQLMGTINFLFQVLPAASIICFISLLMMTTTVMLFLRYFCLDNYDTRKRLVVGCALMVTANMVTFIGVSIACFASEQLKGSYIVQLVPQYIIPMLLWVYYRMICQQWV